MVEGVTGLDVYLRHEVDGAWRGSSDRQAMSFEPIVVGSEVLRE